MGDGGPATSAILNGPTGVAADYSGNFYISDDVGDRIRMVSSGIITTIAGSGTRDPRLVASFGGYSGDGGPATAAELDAPSGIAIDCLHLGGVKPSPSGDGFS